jgi:predicted ATPase
MSRFYDMTVEVSGHDSAKVSEIQAAAKEQWPFEDWWFQDEEIMQSSAQDYLCGGLTEEEFTERLGVAIWRANGGFCEVSVDATFLEDLPYEVHTLAENDYARLTQQETKNEDDIDH